MAMRLTLPHLPVEENPHLRIYFVKKFVGSETIGEGDAFWVPTAADMHLSID